MEKNKWILPVLFLVVGLVAGYFIGTGMANRGGDDTLYGSPKQFVESEKGINVNNMNFFDDPPTYVTWHGNCYECYDNGDCFFEHSGACAAQVLNATLGEGLEENSGSFKGGK